MYEFKEAYCDGVFCGYYVQTKFSNGQTGVLFFGREIMSKAWEWNMRFTINSKKKRIWEWLEGKRSMDTMTGECGLEGLMSAKNGLIAFEEFLKEENPYQKQRIVVAWSDSRRKRVYTRYLTKLGYRFTIHCGREFLIKDITGD